MHCMELIYLTPLHREHIAVQGGRYHRAECRQDIATAIREQTLFLWSIGAYIYQDMMATSECKLGEG